MGGVWEEGELRKERRMQNGVEEKLGMVRAALLAEMRRYQCCPFTSVDKLSQHLLSVS